MYYNYSKLQPEIVDIKKKLAKKYGLSYERASQAIDSRFFILREQLKKMSFRDKIDISVRLYKFAMFFVHKEATSAIRHKMEDKLKRLKGEEEEVVTNLKAKENEQSK